MESVPLITSLFVLGARSTVTNESGSEMICVRRGIKKHLAAFDDFARSLNVCHTF